VADAPSSFVHQENEPQISAFEHFTPVRHLTKLSVG